MNKVISAVIWKEYSILNHRLKSIVISTAFTLMFLVSVGCIRIFFSIKTTDNPKLIIENMMLYIAITSGYMLLVSLLRFWQEKSQKTIETLLSLPTNIQSILVSKCIVPIFFCLLFTVVELIIVHIIFILIFDIAFLSIKAFVCNIIVILILDLPFAIVNGFTMWCMNITYSKMMQVFCSLFYVGLLFMFITFANLQFYSILRVILICGAVLWCIATLCLCLMKKEKVVLNLQD